MDIDSLNVYKSMISDSIVSNDLSKTAKRDYLTKFVLSITSDDLDSRSLLISYLNTELDKYFFDSDKLSDEEINFLNDQFKDLYHIPFISY